MDRGDITITSSTFIAHYLFMASAVHVFLQMNKTLSNLHILRVFDAIWVLASRITNWIPLHL